MYQAILFSPDGDFVTDAHNTESIEKVWERVNDWGSRWFFYPFVFVTTENKGRIVDCPDFPYLNQMKYKSIKTVSEFIKENGQELCDILNN